MFHAYDIRARFPDELNAGVAERLGTAVALFFRGRGPAPTLVVARDARPSSEEIHTALVRALAAAGIDVVDIGIASTPTFYWYVAAHEYDGGVQITASHNPLQWNGMKIVGPRAAPVFAETGLREIERLYRDGARPEAGQKGNVVMMLNATEEAVRSEMEPVAEGAGDLLVVADAGNGMGALDLTSLFAALPCQFLPLFFDINDHAPPHAPDPTVRANVEELAATVVREKAQLGVATDGDGDRIVFLDETGATVPSHIMRGLVAQMMLAASPGGAICYDIRPGRVTEEMIREAGGRPVLTPVGSPKMKQVMEKEHAAGGVESSGHYFFRLPYGVFEAPALLITRFLNVLLAQRQPLSHIVARYERYANSGERSVAVGDTAAAMNNVERTFGRWKTGELDGLSFGDATWWCNVRPSNTEPLVRAICEANEKSVMEEKIDAVLQALR